MATSDYRKNLIYKRINEATSLNDLIQMLQFIQLETIKNTIKQNIEMMSSNEILNIFHSSLSIETILPMDLIQNIASFNNLSNIKSVSKNFNKCYHKNQMIQSKQREKQFLSEIQTNATHNTWIVDKSRTQLNDKEISLKYKGPIDNIKQAIESANSGDRILIYNGCYMVDYDEIEDVFGNIGINKSLQIIGCGDNVLINWNIGIEGNVYFKNIKFKAYSQICIDTTCSYIMENCDIMLSTCDGILTTDHSIFTAINCNFYADQTVNHTYECIYVDDFVKEVNIIGCQFTGFSIDSDYPCVCIEASCRAGKLTFIDNVFKDNDLYPIGTDKKSRNVLQQIKDVTLQHNKLEYKNFMIQDVMEYFMINVHDVS